MTTEKKILQVITEQKEYIKEFKTEKLVSRKASVPLNSMQKRRARPSLWSSIPLQAPTSLQTMFTALLPHRNPNPILLHSMHSAMLPTPLFPIPWLAWHKEKFVLRKSLKKKIWLRLFSNISTFNKQNY